MRKQVKKEVAVAAAKNLSYFFHLKRVGHSLELKLAWHRCQTFYDQLKRGNKTKYKNLSGKRYFF